MGNNRIRAFMVVCCLSACASCGGGNGGGSSGTDAAGDIATSDQTVDSVPRYDAGCQADVDCDDHIACTKDICAGGGCTNTPDNSSCGAGETCVPAKGGCFKAKSCFKDEDCADFINCTVEGCNQDTKLCESIYDDARCPANTICVPLAWVQQIESDMDEPTEEDPYVGCVATTRCSKDADCGAKDNPCIEAACVAGICAFWPEEYSSCSDGDPCNGEETCHLPDDVESGSLYSCYKYGDSEGDDCDAPPWGWTNEWVCEPGIPVNCDDGDACTVDSCKSVDGACEHEPAQDGDPCGGGVCQDGVCECSVEECQGQCCAADQVCSATGCCKPECTGKSCGGDGCGGSCGKCPGDQACMKGSSCEDIGLKWASIPSGTFQMGCSPNDDDCNSDEEPSHSVTVSGFEMLETEVTEGQYEAVMDGNPSCNYGGGGGADHPVECVTWFNAKTFCEAIGGRLPTEAEWEYAARGGTTTRYYCGDDPECLNDIAWYSENSSKMKHSVKKKEPNSYGLYDMLGNVWEWTNDWLDSSYYESSPLSNPQGPDSGSFRVLRGGCFYDYAGNLRVSLRYYYYPSVDYGVDFGFRCARSE